MKHTGFPFIAAIFTLALGSGVVTAAGCGGTSVTTLCDDVCACQRCTSNDLQACQDKGSAAADAADAAGCSSEFADAVTCTSAHVSCKGDQVVAEGCEAELKALSQCSITLSVFGKSDCQIAVDQVTIKLAGCPVPPQTTSSSSGGGQSECSAAQGKLLLCQVAAFTAASCDCLGAGDITKCTADESKAFSDAFTACK